MSWRATTKVASRVQLVRVALVTNVIPISISMSGRRPRQVTWRLNTCVFTLVALSRQCVFAYGVDQSCSYRIHTFSTNPRLQEWQRDNGRIALAHVARRTHGIVQMNEESLISTL